MDVGPLALGSAFVADGFGFGLPVAFVDDGVDSTEAGIVVSLIDEGTMVVTGAEVGAADVGGVVTGAVVAVVAVVGAALVGGST